MAADLSGVDTKIRWAKCQLAALEKSIEGALEAHPGRFVDEMDAETGDYVVRVHDLPEIDPTWSLRVGDVVHNLRSALDHLAWELVKLDGGTPNRDTSFPIRTRNGQHIQLDPAVSDPEILEALKAIQPAVHRYVGPDGRPARWLEGNLWRLHRLDIIDKHRLLLVIPAALDLGGTSWGWWGEHPAPSARFHGGPLAEGDCAARFGMGGREPPLGWDPHLAISITLQEAVLFDLAHRSVVRVLETLANFVEWEVVDQRFRPLFPK